MISDCYSTEMVEGNEYLIALETETNAFNTCYEALNFSKSLAGYIKRTATKHNYSCVGMISTKHHPIEFGSKVQDKNGNVDFPSNLPDFKQPREHRVYVLLIAHPNSDLKEIICEYCRKKGKTMHDIPDYKSHYYHTNITAVYNKSMKIQTINMFSNELNPWAYHFIRIATQEYYMAGNANRLFKDYDCDYISKMFAAYKDKKLIFKGFVEVDKDPSEWENQARIETCNYRKVLLWEDEEIV